MSLAELQLYYSSPKLKKSLSIRKGRKLAIRLKKQSLQKIRRAKAKTIVTTKRQYMLSTAYSDVKVAASHNEDIVIMSVASIFVLLFAAVATAGQTLLNVFLTAFILSESLTVNLIFIAVGTVSALVVLYGWLSAFLANLLAISLMDGAAKRTVRSVRSTFRKSLAYASKVATAWLFLFLCIVVPLMVAAGIGYSAIQIYPVSMAQLLAIAQYTVIAAIVWVFYVLLNYSLLPYVSLFETQESIRSRMLRSKQLVQRKGRMFILAWYIILGSIFGGLYSLANMLSNASNLDKWLIVATAGMPLALLFHSLMVVFYRKRRLARKN